MKVKLFLAGLFVALCSMSFSVQAQNYVRIVNKSASGYQGAYPTRFTASIYSPVQATVQVSLMSGNGMSDYELYPVTFYLKDRPYKHTGRNGFQTVELELNAGYNSISIQTVLNIMYRSYGQIMLERVISGNVVIDNNYQVNYRSLSTSDY